MGIKGGRERDREREKEGVMERGKELCRGRSQGKQTRTLLSKNVHRLFNFLKWLKCSFLSCKLEFGHRGKSFDGPWPGDLSPESSSWRGETERRVGSGIMGRFCGLNVPCFGGGCITSSPKI